MAVYQIRRLEDDQIMTCYDAPEVNGVAQPIAFGGPWGDASQFANEPRLQADIDEEARQIKWSMLRTQRNTKLSQDVDRARWTMVWADSSGTPWIQTDKDAWVSYRQALLDVPQNIADIDALDVSTFVWPTKPGMP